MTLLTRGILKTDQILRYKNRLKRVKSILRTESSMLPGNGEYESRNLLHEFLNVRLSQEPAYISFFSFKCHTQKIASKDVRAMPPLLQELLLEATVDLWEPPCQQDSVWIPSTVEGRGWPSLGHSYCAFFSSWHSYGQINNW